jgi:GTP cyclohydrolase II
MPCVDAIAPDGATRPTPRMRVVATAALPTEFGEFRLVGFANPLDGREHVALVRGDVTGPNVLVRLHSECLTGDAFGSLRCDCRAQLQAAQRRIAEHGRGVILYLRQEGRGIGLLNKIRAYALQEAGLDTVDANRALGFRDDERDYTVAAGMLAALDVDSVRLLTNNPDKVAQLRALGVSVVERVAHEMPSNPHNARYLATKARRSGHLLAPDPSGR